MESLFLLHPVFFSLSSICVFGIPSRISWQNFWAALTADWQHIVQGHKNKKKCSRKTLHDIYWSVPRPALGTSPDVLLRCSESQCKGESLEFPFFRGSWWLTPANDLCLNFFIILHVSNYIRDLGTNVTYPPINPKCLATVIFVIQSSVSCTWNIWSKPSCHWKFFLLEKCCPYQPLAPF